MPLQIIHQNLAAFPCDVIVNPTDEMFSGSGGTDFCVHQAAGKALDAACGKLPPLGVGEIAVTEGYALPCRFIFHTVGPVWEGGFKNEAALLRSCYLNALLQAKKSELTSIAFPLISSGTFGFPKDQVLRIAMDAVSDFLYSADSELQVFLCILDRCSFVLSKELALQEYLNQSKRFVYGDRTEKMFRRSGMPGNQPEDIPYCSIGFMAAPLCGNAAPMGDAAPMPENLADFIRQQDDSFAVMLLKLIDHRGMTDVQCYKKANVTRGTFWKINHDPKYKPSKATVLAFAIALELDTDETAALLRTVGFSLSNSNTFDKIIQFYILNKNYDIFEINAALYQYDQTLLGC